ncbi:hypothetical protein CPC08DRAFT_183985 [Agrocybe pediades]|nr:hypothetical protein CPC08DRAFT_183985 [Agrocybe pediades]
MDFSAPAFDLTPRDDLAARNRFETFKLGKGLPPVAAVTTAAKRGHTRSHSRNASISSSASISLKSTNLNELSHFSFPNNSSISNTLPSISPTAVSPLSTSASANAALAPSTKRNSHHRRRSSVSTRRESAEMMGVALPDLPPSTSEDNINLGEKDSIRRRALWALEGKPDVSFNKVEIPDITTPDVQKMLSDFTAKASSYGNSLSNGKRDSFKLLGPSSSAKDQLGTLLEEEEEEDETVELPSASASKENLPPPNTPITPNTPATPPVLAITKATPAKPRPSNLNLRPLSLTPDTVSSTLPSPSATPSPRTGLRALSLTPASSVDDVPSSTSEKQSRRASFVLSPVPSNQASKKPILNLALDQIERSKSLDEERKPAKRSSISYKRSSQGSVTMMNMAGLPTPEMTPTFGRRYSKDSVATSTDDEVFANHPTQTRPLSASEQHFLFKSHNALLARITDLERALSMRRRESGGYSNGGSSRPASVASNFSSSSEPSDEMLRLIADLKSERDELKRDVDGWRTRVSDMESQMNVLTKRVENERRDAWVARSRVGLLEVEKDVLKKKMEELDNLFAEHEKEKSERETEMTKLTADNASLKARIAELESQLEQTKKELELQKQKKVKEDNDPLATPTPRSFDSFSCPLKASKKHGLGVASVDSESSLTDVEPDLSDEGHQGFGFALKSVQEEVDEADLSEEENGLAGYEDEGEDDTDMSLQSSSSFGSEEDLPRTVSHLQQHVAMPSTPTTPRPQVFTPPQSTHERRATLSKTWTFPFGGQFQTPPKEEENQPVDKFFGCLEDDSDATCSVPSSPSQYSYEKSKNMFASGFKFAANDDASFFLPGGVGIPVVEEELELDEKRLSVVEEDEEEEEADTLSEMDDDEDMFGEAGGICITFTPPEEEQEVEEVKQIQVCSPVKRISDPPVLPALDFGNDDEEEEEEDLSRAIPFNFGRPLQVESQSEDPAPPVSVLITPPSSIGKSVPPSMIPRPASPASLPRTADNRSSITSPTSSAASTPSNASSFVTPPNKRGGAIPSFIPQSVSSPSPIRVMPAAASKLRVVPTSTFIRQPSRKPLLPASPVSGKAQNVSGSSNGSPLIPQSPIIRRSY